MSKLQTHIYRSNEPVQEWPSSVIALCGEKVKDPRPVMILSPDGRLESQSTIYFCQDCSTIALVTATEQIGARWYYGIAGAEQAHRFNLLNRVEDQVF